MIPICSWIFYFDPLFSIFSVFKKLDVLHILVLIPEIGSKESNHEAISQDASSPESNDSNCQESNVQKTDSPDEGNYEKQLEIHDQPSIGKGWMCYLLKINYVLGYMMLQIFKCPLIEMRIDI